MPYIPLRNGQSLFVADPEQAEQRYQQEWGGSTPSEPVATAKPQAKPAAKPSAKAQPKPQRSFNLGEFIQGAASGALQGAVRTGKEALQGAATGFLAGPLAPAVGMLRSAQQLGKTPIPGTKTTVGKEVGRVVQEVPRKLVNDPIAAVQQLGALTQGVDLGGALAGGPMGAGSVGTQVEDPKLFEQRQRNATAAIEALQKSGKDPEGFSYGIRPNVPVLGPLFSEDSDFVRQNVRPETWGGQLAAGVFSAIGGDKGVSKLLKAPSMATKTGVKLSEIWNAKDIKQGTEMMARFLVKDVIPNAIQDAVFFMPQAPAAMQKKFEDIQKLKTPEMRMAEAKVLRATSTNEFNYAFEQLKNVVGGAAALGVLRGAYWAANRALSKATSGTPAGKAFQDAAQEAEPMLRQDLEAEGLTKANDIREQRLGNVNAQLYRKIEENAAEIAKAGRAGAESFITKRQQLLPETENVLADLQGAPDLTPQLQQVDADIAVMQKTLGVKSPEELTSKSAMIQERLAAYEAAIASDPDWLAKSTGAGKKASKNSSKLRLANEAAERIKLLEDLYLQKSEFENAGLQRLAKESELERLTVDTMTASVGFRNSLNDARILVNALDELNAERVQLLESRNSQLFAENRLDELDYDYSFKDAYGEAYGELKDLLNAAEAAVASGNLNDNFMQMFVKQADAIHNKIIDNGGLAPVTPEMPGGTGVGDEVPLTTEAAEPIDNQIGIPRDPAPVTNPVPITKTDSGELMIDSDALAEREFQQAPQMDEVSGSVDDVVKEVNRDLGRNLDPTETKETLSDFVKNVNEIITKQGELVAEDLRNGTDLADEATKIYSTNATKYTSSLENAAAVKAAVDALDNRKAILPQQYGIAIRKMATLLGGDNTLRKVAAFAESEKFGKDIQQNLNKIMVPTSMLDDSAITALRDARDLRRILQGEEVEGLDRTVALINAADSYQVLMANVKAVNELFYGVGNALRLFDRRNRLGFSSRNPEELFSAFNEQLASFGDSSEFADSLSNAAKSAKEELDQGIGQFFKKVKAGEDLTDEELEGFEALVEKVYQSQGDFEKLKELEVTGDAVLARIQVGAPISNPAMIASIPIQGIPEITGQIMGMAVGHTITGTTAKFLGNTPLAAESLGEARVAIQTLLQLRNVIGEALDVTYNRFVYGRSITDPKAAADSAYEISSKSSLRREEAIAQDLSATKLKTPFFDYVMEKSAENEKIFDLLNKSRVMTKVFHDYYMPAEAWSKRSLIGKTIGLPTTALRGMGLGKESYYPSGEDVNLTIFNQLSAAADEFSTALFANASMRTRITSEVDEQIAAGLVKAEDRATVLADKLNKETSDMYKPIKVGFDQKTIGYSVLDNQMLELTRAVNLTEELTGPLGDITESINSWRQSKYTPLAFFARDIFPIITSPINGIKRAVIIAYGGEIVQASSDVVRATASTVVKNLPEEVAKLLPPETRQQVIDFESKYMSKDPKQRGLAQGALAMAVGIQALAFFLVRDGNQDISGGLENSYREAEGAAEPFTWRIGGKTLPYRYFPGLGNTLALHATIRDLQEFAPGRDTSAFIAIAAAALANTILDTPSLAGFDKIIAALKTATSGDVSRLQKMISDSVAKAGDPYLNLRKVIMQGIDPRKPATPVSQFALTKFYSRGKLGKKGITKEDFINSIADSAFGTFGIATEYSPVGVITDALVSVLRKDPEVRTRSRKALWYGPSGETVKANHAGVWYPLQAVLGRYWVFPDKLEDPVAKEMVYNLISPPRKTLYHSDGVGINDVVLNDFNHFLNSEFTFFDPNTQKTQKGVYGYLKRLVTSKEYTQYPGVDSPFKMGPFGLVQDANWNREDNMRRVILKNEVDKLIGIAKEQFLMGDLPGQRYKAPPEMKQMILTNRMTGGLQ